MKEIDNCVFLDIAESAAFVGVSESTIWRSIARGILPRGRRHGKKSYWSQSVLAEKKATIVQRPMSESDRITPSEILSRAGEDPAEYVFRENVQEVFGVPVTQLYSFIRQGLIPKPKKILGRAFWKKKDIEACWKEHVRSRLADDK